MELRLGDFGLAAKLETVEQRKKYDSFLASFVHTELCLEADTRRFKKHFDVHSILKL